MVKIEREIPIQIDPGENPFLKGIYAPIATEITADDLTVIGEIPKDLDGAYLRHGPNPIFQPRRRYHWFDGDGMVHGIEFHDGKATYRNRWIRTEAFAAEQTAQPRMPRCESTGCDMSPFRRGIRCHAPCRRRQTNGTGREAERSDWARCAGTRRQGPAESRR